MLMGWIMMAASVQYDVMAIMTVTPRIQNVWGEKTKTGLIAVSWLFGVCPLCSAVQDTGSVSKKKK